MAPSTLVVVLLLLVLVLLLQLPTNAAIMFKYGGVEGMVGGSSQGRLLSAWAAEF